MSDQKCFACNGTGLVHGLGGYAVPCKVCQPPAPASAPTEPQIVGYGRTSKHVEISWSEWGDRPWTIMQASTGKLKRFEEPLSIEEIAAKHESLPPAGEQGCEKELPDAPGVWHRTADGFTNAWLIYVDGDEQLKGAIVGKKGHIFYMDLPRGHWHRLTATDERGEDHIADIGKKVDEGSHNWMPSGQHRYGSRGACRCMNCMEARLATARAEAERLSFAVRDCVANLLCDEPGSPLAVEILAGSPEAALEKLLLAWEQLRRERDAMAEALKACGVFTTTQERLRHWDEYKQDAADRIDAALSPQAAGGEHGEA